MSGLKQINNTMSAIYLHIPFCLSKCAYCAFYSIADQKLKSVFVEALKKEIELRSVYIADEVKTVYFGGGTPTTLQTSEIEEIIGCLHAHLNIASNAEITIEANPDTLSPDYLASLRHIGINRLSIGIQCFDDDDLRLLGRRHNSRHALQCIDDAHKAGFDNISIDLIYGIPGSTSWERNLDTFFSLGIPHLSAYALTVEENSILKKQIAKGLVPSVNEEDSLRDYSLLCETAGKNGFLHYEISNFAKPTHHSRHNSSYWNGTHYVGFGPAAHSYNGISRQWNVANVKKYVDSLMNNDVDVLFEKEELDENQRYNEYVITALRTLWGCDLVYVRREMGERFSSHLEKQAKPLIDNGSVTRTREFIHLNDQQMLMADSIAVQLMI